MLAGDEANLTDWVRDNPAAIAAYLTENLQENDPSRAQAALSLVARAQNVQILARDAGLRRDTLYRTFSGRIDPQISRVLKLLEAMNVKPDVVPVSGADVASVATHLNQALACTDPADAIRALSAVVKSLNVTALALELGIMRTTVYKTFGGSVDPQLGRVLNLFRALQVKFTVVPVPAKVRPPRPKLGRPPKRLDRPQ